MLQDGRPGGPHEPSRRADRQHEMPFHGPKCRLSAQFLGHFLDLLRTVKLRVSFIFRPNSTKPVEGYKEVVLNNETREILRQMLNGVPSQIFLSKFNTGSIYAHLYAYKLTYMHTYIHTHIYICSLTCFAYIRHTCIKYDRDVYVCVAGYVLMWLWRSLFDTTRCYRIQSTRRRAEPPLQWPISSRRLPSFRFTGAEGDLSASRIGTSSTSTFYQTRRSERLIVLYIVLFQALVLIIFNP